MFSAAEVASLRSESEAAMVDTATLTTTAHTRDAGGGYAAGAPATASTACRIGRVRASEARLAASLQLTEVVDAVLAVPLETAAIPIGAGVSVAFARGGTAEYSIVGVVPLATHAIDQRYLVQKVVT